MAEMFPKLKKIKLVASEEISDDRLVLNIQNHAAPPDHDGRLPVPFAFDVAGPVRQVRGIEFHSCPFNKGMKSTVFTGGVCPNVYSVKARLAFCLDFAKFVNLEEIVFDMFYIDDIDIQSRFDFRTLERLKKVVFCPIINRNFCELVIADEDDDEPCNKMVRSLMDHPSIEHLELNRMVFVDASFGFGLSSQDLSPLTTLVLRDIGICDQSHVDNLWKGLGNLRNLTLHAFGNGEYALSNWPPHFLDFSPLINLETLDVRHLAGLDLDRSSFETEGETEPLSAHLLSISAEWCTFASPLRGPNLRSVTLQGDVMETVPGYDANDSFKMVDPLDTEGLPNLKALTLEGVELTKGLDLRYCGGLISVSVSRCRVHQPIDVTGLNALDHFERSEAPFDLIGYSGHVQEVEFHL